MSILVGTNEIDNVFVGDQELDGIYIGNEEVWSNCKVIDLGTGTSFNVASYYNKYSELTSENFFVLTFTSKTGTASCGAGEYVRCSSNLVKNYNASSGILSCYVTVNGANTSCRVFLVTKPSKLIYLGNGTSFNLSNIEGYSNFTVNNFLFRSLSKTNSDYNGYRAEGGTGSNTVSCVKTYNATNGQLSFYFRANGSSYVDSWDTANNIAVFLYKKGV